MPKNNDKNKRIVMFFGIVLIAAFLRFYKISEVPPSLNWDEVSHGYNAYSILKSGRDEWGVFLPSIFRAYGDYKLPAYIYLTTASEFFFGLTPFAVRLPSVLAGIGTVIVTYLLVLELFSRKKVDSLSTSHNPKSIALLAALLIAMEPWSFFLSRGAFEANLALFFFVAGVYFFFRAIRSLSAIYQVLSTIFLSLTLWTYNSYRIFTPLMVIALIAIYRKELLTLFKKFPIAIYCSLLTLLISLIPMLHQMFTEVGQARYEEVKILDKGTIARIEEQRNLGGSRLVHNKVTYFSWQFVKNYFSHFDPKFLAFEGGNNYQFSVPGEGLLGPVDLLMIVIALCYLVGSKEVGLKTKTLVLSWLLLSPLPSSVTREAPHVLRSATMLPVPMLLVALGIVTTAYFSWKTFLGRFWAFWQKRTFLVPPITVASFTLILYGVVLYDFLMPYYQYYFKDYSIYYSQPWQHGYKETVNYAKEYYDKYDKIIVSKKYGEPHEFFLFYWPWDPEMYTNDPKLNRFYQSNWYWVDRFDKFYFVNDWDIPREEWQDFKLESSEKFRCDNQKCLLITSPENRPKTWKLSNVVYFLDGSTAFEIYEN